MVEYMKEHLNKILNEYGYKGLIFKCQTDLYSRYHDGDFKDILLSICYNSLSEPVSEPENISELLIKRVKEHLPDKIEQNTTNRLKAGASVPGIGTAEGEKVENMNKVFQSPKPFKGLIERYLRTNNLMIIIVNENKDISCCNDFISSLDFKKITSDIIKNNTTNNKYCNNDYELYEQKTYPHLEIFKAKN